MLLWVDAEEMAGTASAEPVWDAEEAATVVTLMPTRELLAAVVAAGVAEPILELAAELFKRFFGISSSISLSGSLIRALISCVACLVDSVPPLLQRKEGEKSLRPSLKPPPTQTIL